MGWNNWLEEVELDFICVLNQTAEAAYSVLASDWPGVRRGGKEGVDAKKTALICAFLPLQVLLALPLLPD